MVTPSEGALFSLLSTQEATIGRSIRPVQNVSGQSSCRQWRQCSGRSHWHVGAVSTSSISYSEVAPWLSAFRTYSSRPRPAIASWPSSLPRMRLVVPSVAKPGRELDAKGRSCPADRREAGPGIKRIGGLTPGDEGLGHLLQLSPRGPALSNRQLAEHPAQPN